MKTQEKTQFPMIPKNDKKCVWMELGIVSYKICDRNFQCETCPLDQGLRGDMNITNHPKQEVQKLIDSNKKQQTISRKQNSSLERLLKIRLDKDCSVHPGHCWIKVLSQNRVKVGIDDIVATTLGSIDEVILPLPGEKIKRGANCGQVIQFEHIFSIVSPLSGKVVKINNELTDFPDELTLDPLIKGWMLVIKPDNLEQDLKYCRSGDALFSWYLKEFKWLESNLTKGFQQEPDTVGITLNDGGEISRNLRNYLPHDQYRRLVLSLLGMPESGR